MSLEFIPTVWAARLLTALQGSLVYGQAGVVNRDYEGEIREAGNTVKIASIGNVTIDNYPNNAYGVVRNCRATNCGPLAPGAGSWVAGKLVDGGGNTAS